MSGLPSFVEEFLDEVRERLQACGYPDVEGQIERKRAAMLALYESAEFLDDWDREAAIMRSDRPFEEKWQELCAIADGYLEANRAVRIGRRA
jgi:hypothetical protein